METELILDHEGDGNEDWNIFAPVSPRAVEAEPDRRKRVHVDSTDQLYSNLQNILCELYPEFSIWISVLCNQFF